MRRSRSGRPRRSTDMPPQKLRGREQKLQHLRGALGPGALAVVGAAILVAANIEAARLEAIAQHADVVERVEPLAAAGIEPDAEAGPRVLLDRAQNHAIVPPDRGRH